MDKQSVLSNPEVADLISKVAPPIGISNNICGVVLTQKNGYDWYCTRETGHIGYHVAHVPDGTAAVIWPREG